MFAHVTATAAERAAARPGDDLVSPADVVMDRGCTVPGTPAQVWPWIAQLGKARAGWYLPRWLERALPSGRRAIRHIDPRYLQLAPGDVIPDYGGPRAAFTVARLEPDASIVYTSQRGRLCLTWAITLTPLAGPGQAPATRIHLRLRLAPVRHPWLARTAGELADLLSIAGLATGLRQRLEESLP